MNQVRNNLYQYNMSMNMMYYLDKYLLSDDEASDDAENDPFGHK